MDDMEPFKRRAFVPDEQDGKQSSAASMPSVGRPRKPQHPLGLMSAAELMAKKLPAIRYIVPGYLSEGLTLIGGKAKLGKSWLLLGIAIAVSTGGVALNSIPVEQGDVLYLALEDNERRLQKRLRQLLPNGDAPARLLIDITAPRLDDGLLDLLRAWIDQAADPRLIIVDVLNRVRPKQGGQEGLYDYDVRCLEGMQSLAADYGIAIVLVHHTRKAEAEDPFDCLSGSTGLTGTADTTLVLARDSQGTTLYGRGRDVEEIESALTFDKTTGHWTLLGAATEVRRSGERGSILTALKEARASLSPREVSDTTGMDYTNIRQLLVKMARDGEVEKAGRGLYRHPETPVTTVTRSQAGPNVYRFRRDGEDE